MTRKDYEGLADAIESAWWSLDDVTTIGEAFNAIVSRVADYCEKDNPRFDRAKFGAACDHVHGRFVGI